MRGIPPTVALYVRWDWHVDRDRTDRVMVGTVCRGDDDRRGMSPSITISPEKDRIVR